MDARIQAEEKMKCKIFIKLDFGQVKIVIHKRFFSLPVCAKHASWKRILAFEKFK